MLTPKDTGFRTSLTVESVDATTWKLLDALVYEGAKGDFIRVEAGEITDFASVPTLLQGIMPRTGAWTKAAVVHDMLCRELNHWHQLTDAERIVEYLLPPNINAVDTDGIFRSIMRRSGVGPVRRRLAWTAVRWAALFNPARSEGWLSTAPAVVGTSALVLLWLTCVVRVIAWVVPG